MFIFLFSKALGPAFHGGKKALYNYNYNNYYYYQTQLTVLSSHVKPVICPDIRTDLPV